MNFQDFIKKMADDSALVDKMNGASNPDEAYAVAKEAGLTDSFEVFSKGMAALNKSQSELSASEVDAIVGGATTTEIVSAVTSSVSAAATAAGAAAV